MPTIDEVMKEFNKKFKADLVHIGLPEYDYVRIPFTSPRLNYMTFGGLPVGKLIEFYGPEHGGKTTTALDIVASYQVMQREEENPKKAMWVDAENTFDEKWAKTLGVNLDDLVFCQPENQSAEEIFDLVLDMVQTNQIGLVVIDSIGIMVSKQALEKDVVDKTYGGISKALTDFSSRASGLCNHKQCTVIGINQEREDMNSSFGAMKTPGGKAWKHNCSVRLKFTKGQYFDDAHKVLTSNAENPMGNYVQVSMTKNKTCKPTRRTGFYSLKYYEGIDYIYDLVEVAIKNEIIEQSGAWFTIIDKESGEILKDKIQGQSNVCKFLIDDDNVEILAKVESQIDALVQED